MCCLTCRRLVQITIFLCFVSTVFQVSNAATDSKDDDDDEIFQRQNKFHKRKSARMAFLEESDDPMFKFLTKMLTTAQLKSKNMLARAQNGIKRTQELETEVANKLRKNHLEIKEYER